MINIDKIKEYSIYTLLCVLVFATTTLICGWVCYDYSFLLKLQRIDIILFICLNLVIDFYAVLLAIMNFHKY
jgi:hypothetical protein